ncbi:peptide deformylase [Aggregatilineales bacterium SYSU G02658]
MAVRPIVTSENPVLRKKAIKVVSFDASFQTLVDDMIDTVKDAPGVGLAAPQVGVSQRVIVVNLPDEPKEYGENAGKVFVVANPKIIKTSKQTVLGTEGCLSIPGYLGEVERFVTVVVTGQDRYGKDFRMRADDWFARIFQHEIDHLDGILYIDRTDKVWKAKDEENVTEA